MKQFEKWYNQTIRPYIHNPKDKEPLKEGWRVALEMVLRIKKDGEILAHYNGDILMAIEGEIKRELES